MPGYQPGIGTELVIVIVLPPQRSPDLLLERSHHPTDHVDTGMIGVLFPFNLLPYTWCIQNRVTMPLQAFAKILPIDMLSWKDFDSNML